MVHSCCTIGSNILERFVQSQLLRSSLYGSSWCFGVRCVVAILQSCSHQQPVAVLGSPLCHLLCRFGQSLYGTTSLGQYRCRSLRTTPGSLLGHNRVREQHSKFLNEHYCTSCHYWFGCLDGNHTLLTDSFRDQSRFIESRRRHACRVES